MESRKNAELGTAGTDGCNNKSLGRDKLAGVVAAEE
jgi:hypothetical protein